MTRPMQIETHLSEQAQTKATLMIPVVYDNAPQEPAHWEYLVLKVDTREEAVLATPQMNELGSKGWFLAGMLRQKEEAVVHYYFVRQRTD